jgi:hypothetical protein
MERRTLAVVAVGIISVIYLHDKIKSIHLLNCVSIRFYCGVYRTIVKCEQDYMLLYGHWCVAILCYTDTGVLLYRAIRSAVGAIHAI